ncbi:YbgC/FadM family acyl-CoA thioesterase [Lichenicola sp.]|uniref:YbgC/FadM family acyl-CoA thioesterase n=1 Tax=Lichenicola sp. TaxID=2804529 RepID=UPI003B00B3A1
MATHQVRFRVYYEDTDAGGVMYHAQYLAFAERGRSEALREAGASAISLLQEHGIAFVVRRALVDYLRPLRLDDLVTVSTDIAERRGASVRLRQTLQTEPTPDAAPVLHARLEITLASIRTSDGRPVRVPEPWATVLGRLSAPD